MNVFIGYDPITRTYVLSHLLAVNNACVKINLYNDDFKKLKAYQVDCEYDDFNNNGVYVEWLHHECNAW